MKYLMLVLIMATFISNGQEADSLRRIIPQLEESDTNKVHAIVDLAAIHYHDNLDTSRLLLTQALVIARKQNYKRGEGFSNTGLSGYFFQKGDLDSALIYANRGAKILESINDKQHILAAYNNMALIYNNMEKPDEAIGLYLKIFRIIESNPPSIQHMAICNNLAVAYGNKKSLVESKKWFQKVSAYAEKMQHPMGLVYGYNGTAGVNIELQEFGDAISNSQKGLDLSLEHGMDKTAIEAYQNLGKVYVRLGQYNKAISYLDKGLTLAKKIGSKRNLEVIYNELSTSYENLQNYTRALDYNKLYHQTKDSVFAEDKVKLIEDLEKKYETAELKRKQSEIEFANQKLERENELNALKTQKLSQAKELADLKANRNRNLLFGAIALSIILGFGGALYFSQYKSRKRAELARLELEESNKRLQIENQFKESELKAIKAQMNPHFMFNALNSIQEYIILNKKDLASDYLGKFADLMRLYLNQSNENLIELEDEIKTLHLYIELEALRQEDLVFAIKCESNELLEVKIPPMLIQPYVENAIKHGLWHKKNDKKLKILFYKKNELLNIEIIDNGIGIEASKRINARKHKHKSFSMQANKTRLDIIQDRHKNKLSIQTIDISEGGEIKGTKVTLQIPLNLG